MNVGIIPSNTFPNIYAISAAQGSRVAVPVSPSAYIYSHFKHVSGVPAAEGETGVNINKLKIIDTLIEQLSKMKKEPDPLVDKVQDEEKRMNSLLEKIRTIQTANAKNPFAPAVPHIGTIFNLSA
jgi:predicted transcriptional regulator